MKKVVFLMLLSSIVTVQADNTCVSCKALSSSSTQDLSKNVSNVPYEYPKKTYFDHLVQMLPIEVCTCKPDQNEKDMMNCTCSLKTEKGQQIDLSGRYNKVMPNPHLQLSIDANVVSFER